jgi:hypothetical protein
MFSLRRSNYSPPTRHLPRVISRKTRKNIASHPHLAVYTGPPFFCFCLHHDIIQARRGQPRLFLSSNSVAFYTLSRCPFIGSLQAQHLLTVNTLVSPSKVPVVFCTVLFSTVSSFQQYTPGYSVSFLTVLVVYVYLWDYQDVQQPCTISMRFMFYFLLFVFELASLI